MATAVCKVPGGLPLSRLSVRTISSSIVAFGFSRIKWKGRDKIFVLVILTMIIPTEIVLTPLYLIYTNLERKELNKWYVRDVCATVSVKLPCNMSHSKILSEIRLLEGIRYVKEL